MAVKFAKVFECDWLQHKGKKKKDCNNFQGCPIVIQCFGDEITGHPSGKMFENLLLEYASGGALRDLINKSGGSGLPKSKL